MALHRTFCAIENYNYLILLILNFRLASKIATFPYFCHKTYKDGLVEKILEHERGRCHRYRIEKGFKPPLSFLVRWGEGEFLFMHNGEGTQLDWNYTYELTTPLVYPIAAPILKLFLCWTLQGALDGIREKMLAGES